MDHVDADLSPEEQGYVRHYLGYADALIRSAEEKAPLESREGDSSAMSIDQPPAEGTNEPGSDKKNPKEKAA
ncbi:MAG TPA: hypothetical protein VE604_02585 [Candidatus Polarisedimenticolia bacterium]|nr:hypothetical protein [Candidatus Polarisedimenticolia bacterium]